MNNNNNNSILLHICCGPCAIMPITRLQEAGFEVTGYFYNPNIHPLEEYLKRREGAAQVADRTGIPINYAMEDEDYNTVKWLHMVHQKEQQRCPICWQSRLEKTYHTAVANRFNFFSSSLLYSRYQNHEVIRSIGENLSKNGSTAFYYGDFRTDWQAGIDCSKEFGIYRQKYCGCIFSENERFAKKLRTSNCELTNNKHMSNHL